MSPAISSEVPCCPQGRSTLAAILRDHAHRVPGKIAVRFLERGEGEGIALTYGELDRQARSLAARLIREGAAGQRVLLVYPAGIPFIVSFYACLYAGAVAVPTPFISPARSAPQIAAIAADCEPCVILTCTALAQDKSLKSSCPGELSDRPWIVTDPAVEEEAASGIPVVLPAGTPAFLQYTSGSTANPRGVVVTHGNLLANMEMIRSAFCHDEDTRLVSWLPLFHDMGLVGCLLQPLYLGGMTVLMSPIDFIQRPLRWLQAIARFKATTSAAPNFAYAMCADRIRPEQLHDLDLRSWRAACCGAEPIRADDLRRFAKTLAPAGFSAQAFFPCYGLAEATLFVSGGPAGTGLRSVYHHDDLRASAGTERVICGEIAKGVTVAIVDPETGRRMPEGQIGEIWVNGPNVGAGYWRQPEQTQTVFQARPSDSPESAPYLRTGDLGMMRDNTLTIVGRLKETITIRGTKHHPEDIEAAASRAHPALATAAAFAVDRNGAEEIIVLAEVKRGQLAELDFHQAATAVWGSICEIFGVRPADVLLLAPGSIPRTTSNKIRRSACRTAYLGADLTRLNQAQGASMDAGATHVLSPAATDSSATASRPDASYV